MLKIDPKLMKYFKNHECGQEIIMISLYVNHYRLKPVASITLAKQINEMKSQNYLVCDAFLVLQYIFVLVAHLDFPLSQQNNL